MAATPAVGQSSIDSVTARNSTQINLAIQLTSGSGAGSWVRIGRVQSMSEDISNNVQVLSELGSQFAVELKKGITTFTFSIAKFYVHTDVFDQLSAGQIFGLQVQDNSLVNPTTGNGQVVLEQFQSCSLNTVSKSWQVGQATVATNGSVVAIGQSYGAPD